MHEPFRRLGNAFEKNESVYEFKYVRTLMLAHCKSSTTNYQFMQLIDQFMLDIRMILSFFSEGARVRAINVSLSNRFSISTRSLFFFSFNSCQSNKKSLSFEISWYFAEKKKNIFVDSCNGEDLRRYRTRKSKFFSDGALKTLLSYQKFFVKIHSSYRVFAD